ncbi:MAG: carboxylating nicotinate-nucleotide diphosphorylase [Nitrososphaerales archaeon]
MHDDFVYRKFIEWIEEDAPYGDETTEALIDDRVYARAILLAKEDGLLAGLNDMCKALKRYGIKILNSKIDGYEFKNGETLLTIEGKARDILLIERTLINLISRCSGIATETKKMVSSLNEINNNLKLAVTRKTAPGLRYFDKLAAKVGGADTHRMGLSDAILIKDNHIKIIDNISNALKLAKKRCSFTKKVEIEVTSTEQALEAAKEGADIIMLDNLSISDVKDTIERLNKEGLRDRILIEVSGGINPENIYEYARLPIDIISSGWITHSPRAVNMSLEVIKTWKED